MTRIHRQVLRQEQQPDQRQATPQEHAPPIGLVKASTVASLPANDSGVHAASPRLRLGLR
jgi:hypothetical protein